MLRFDDRKVIVLSVCAFLRSEYGVIFTNQATATEKKKDCIFYLDYFTFLSLFEMHNSNEGY